MTCMNSSEGINESAAGEKEDQKKENAQNVTEGIAGREHHGVFAEFSRGLRGTRYGKPKTRASDRLATGLWDVGITPSLPRRLRTEPKPKQIYSRWLHRTAAQARCLALYSHVSGNNWRRPLLILSDQLRMAFGKSQTQQQEHGKYQQPHRNRYLSGHASCKNAQQVESRQDEYV